MLDINLFRESPEVVRDALARRGEDPAVVDAVVALDERRRAALTEVEALRARRNAESKAIGQVRDAVERQSRIEAMRGVNARIDAVDADLASIEAELQARLQQVPNLPRADVPVGASEHDNVVVRHVGDLPAFDFEPRPHWDLGPALGLIDFDRGTRLSGSRFYVLHGPGARLQRALIQWMLDTHAAGGYAEVYTPFIVREQCMWNAGQLPKFIDNLYHDAEDDVWLVPTAEVPLTNLHADEILADDQLPLHYVAYTPCFRREKMSAGRDVRGIKRGHQFDKVEMYKFTRPEDSPAALDAMLADGEALLQALGLPYRVVQLCTADLGFGSTITYDLEVWAAGCGEWLEVSSISDFGSFQARRAGIRFRRSRGAPTEFVHTLNGSGLGLPRTLIAVIENNQRADGTVAIPEVLQARMGASEIRG
ncbi:serine--tRNA ligase [bacterium]|nr:serine--tRNA ligase [Chloroflexi bacterium CFX6]RIL08757.1 MAG: serine--tRNA ligase [bacterium]